MDAVEDERENLVSPSATRKRKSDEHAAESGSKNARKVLGESNNANRAPSGLQPPGWAKNSSFKGASVSSSARKSGRSRGSGRGGRADAAAGEAEAEAEEELLTVSIPTVPIEEIACTIFGALELRESQKAELLKRTKPDQKLFGYPKKYVDNETKRLATGIKEHFNARDKFIDACKDFERAARSALEAAKYKVEQLDGTAKDHRRKLAAAEQDLADARKLESTTKGKLAELQAEAKAQQTKYAELAAVREGLDAAMNEVRGQLAAAEARVAEEQAKAAKLEDELARMQLKLDEAAATADGAAQAQKAALDEQQTLFDAECAKWSVEREAAASALAQGQAKLDEVSAKLAAMGEDLRTSEARAQAAESEAQRLREAQAAMQGQVVALQAQAQQKDLHLDKTLETFQQNQTFSQERIASLSEEKAKLEVRVNELTDAKGTLEVQKTELSGSLKEATEANAALTATLREQSESMTKAQDELATLRANSAGMEQNIERAARENAALTVQVGRMTSELEQERKAHTAEKEKLCAELATANERANTLEQRNSDLESEVQALRSTYGQGGISNDAQLERLCEVSKEAEKLKRQVTDLDHLHDEVAKLRAQLKDTESLLFESDKAKRRLHNEVQALKGKVRVVARVRPIFSARGKDAEGDIKMTTALPEHISCTVDGSALAVETEQEQTSGTTLKKHEFAFDRVFGPATQQEDVFDEVSSFVQSALDGYNVCLFSYGQTGSGKTHTMTGDHSCPVQRGIIPRSIDQIMSYQTELRSKGWEYSLEAQYLEIYNESIRDLLQGASGAGSKLEIRDSKKEIIVTNAKRLPIETKADIHRVLDLAERNRSVAATDLNAHSSRSHSVFTLFIKGVHREFSAQVVGSLSMCDLAGSERISRSGAEGDRLKEAQAINKSLSSLSNVFSALHKKTSHVPYRNSKLTHMLQPCFAGEGKTMMIVNLSPELSDRGESLCSLRFAGQVHSTELGRAKKQISALEK